MTEEKPPACADVADKIRFTPGRMFPYSADEPDTTGTGTVPGHDTDSDVPPAAISASVPAPPSENVTESPGTAAGASSPSPSRFSEVETGTHDPCCRTRTGSTFSVYVSCPSGSAAVSDVPVVRAATVTGLPDDFARADAADTAASSAACAPDTPAFIGASTPPPSAPGSGGNAGAAPPVTPRPVDPPDSDDALARGSPSASSPATRHSTTSSLRTADKDTGTPAPTPRTDTQHGPEQNVTSEQQPSSIRN